MEKLKRYSLTEIVCYKWTDPKMFCLSSDVAAIEARVEELESALAASRGKLQEAEKALEEYGTHKSTCAVYKRTDEMIERIETPPCTCGLDAALAEMRKE